MAASAANLTSTVGDESGRPSIFELLSQQGFSHALKPAFYHIIKTLAERFPEGRVPIVFRNFDEFYLAFDSLVQWHYFLTRGATLSEAFYGLERKMILKENHSNRIQFSYILAVIVPYLQNKVDKAYQRSIDETTAERITENDNSAQFSTIKIILKYYPYIKAGISFMNLLCILAYAFKYSDSHDVLLKFLGIKLSYTSPNRTKFIKEKSTEIFQLESWKNMKKLPILVLRSLGESVLFGVEMGSFFVQFLDWWYNDPKRERVMITSLPVPPPISSDDQNYIKLSEKEKNKCPLCKRQFRNPTAISTSGVVYCYGCIFPHLKPDGKCPLTSLRFTMDNLIRLFP